MKSSTLSNLLPALCAAAIAIGVVLALPDALEAERSAKAAPPLAAAPAQESFAAPASAWPYPAPQVDASAPPAEQPPTF